MGDGVVVDAQIISSYCQQSIDKTGDIYDLIEKLLENCGLAITMLIETEWHNTCGNYLFEVWFTDNLRDLRIRYVNPNLEPAIVKKIHNDFGLPRDGRDIEYIKASNDTTFKYILTYDIHFFDPKMNRANSKTKNLVKKGRIGALCRFLKRKLDITVGLPEHCTYDLREHFTNIN